MVMRQPKTAADFPSGTGSYMGGGRRAGVNAPLPSGSQGGFGWRGTVQEGIDQGRFRPVGLLSPEELRSGLLQGPYGPTYNPGATQGGAAGGPMGPGTPVTSLDAILDQETREMQAAADQQYKTLADIASDFSTSLGEREDSFYELMGNAFDLEDQAGELDRLAEWDGSEIESLASELGSSVKGQVSRANKLLEDLIGETRSNTKEMVDDAIARSDKATRMMAKAAGNFKDSAAAAASAAARGVHRAFQSRIKMISANPNLSEGERQQMRQEAEVEAIQSAAEAMNPLSMRYEELKLGAEQQVAQFQALSGDVVLKGVQALQNADNLSMQGVAQMLRGSEIQTNAFATISSALQTNAKLRAEFGQMAANFRLNWANTQAATHLAAIQSLIQGRSAHYNMILENPRTYISRFEGLLALETMRKANAQDTHPTIQVPSSGYDSLLSNFGGLQEQLDGLRDDLTGGGGSDGTGRGSTGTRNGGTPRSGPGSGVTDQRKRSRAQAIASRVRQARSPSDQKQMIELFNKEFGTSYTSASQIEQHMKEQGFYG